MSTINKIKLKNNTEYDIQQKGYPTISSSDTGKVLKVKTTAETDSSYAAEWVTVEDTTYTLPTASADTLGGVKVGTNLSISNGVLSATDTTYSVATTSADGLMSSTDKGKLDNITITNNKIAASCLESIHLCNYRGSTMSKQGLISLDSAEVGDFAYVTEGDDAGIYVLTGSGSDAYATASNWKVVTAPSLNATVSGTTLTFA